MNGAVDKRTACTQSLWGGGGVRRNAQARCTLARIATATNFLAQTSWFSYNCSRRDDVAPTTHTTTSRKRKTISTMQSALCKSRPEHPRKRRTNGTQQQSAAWTDFPGYTGADNCSISRLPAAGARCLRQPCRPPPGRLPSRPLAHRLRPRGLAYPCSGVALPGQGPRRWQSTPVRTTTDTGQQVQASKAAGSAAEIAVSCHVRMVRALRGGETSALVSERTQHTGSSGEYRAGSWRYNDRQRVVPEHLTPACTWLRTAALFTCLRCKASKGTLPAHASSIKDAYLHHLTARQTERSSPTQKKNINGRKYPRRLSRRNGRQNAVLIASSFDPQSHRRCWTSNHAFVTPPTQRSYSRAWHAVSTWPWQVGHVWFPSRRLSVRLTSPAPLQLAQAATYQSNVKIAPDDGKRVRRQRAGKEQSRAWTRVGGHVSTRIRITSYFEFKGRLDLASSFARSSPLLSPLQENNGGMWHSRAEMSEPPRECLYSIEDTRDAPNIEREKGTK